MEDVAVDVLPKVASRPDRIEQLFGGVQLNQDAVDVSQFIDSHGLNVYPALFTPVHLESGVSIGLSDKAKEGLSLNGDDRPYLLDVAHVGEQDRYETMVVFQPGVYGSDIRTVGIINGTGFYIPFKQPLEHQSAPELKAGELTARLDIHQATWLETIPGSILPALSESIKFEPRQAVNEAEPLPFTDVIDRLSEEVLARHSLALEKAKEMETNPDFLPVLQQYRKALATTANFEEVGEFMTILEGAEEMVHIARNNYVAQIDELLIEARRVHDQGGVRIRTYGHRLSYESLEDIKVVLEQLTNDVAELNKIVYGEEGSGKGGDLFSQAVLRLDRFMFEGKAFKEIEDPFDDVVVLYSEIKENPVPRIIGEENSRLPAPAGKTHESGILAVPFNPTDTLTTILQKIKQTQGNSNEFTPKTIVIHAPNKEFLSWNPKSQANYFFGDALESLGSDLAQMPRQERPHVILFTDDFDPLAYQMPSGFLFCNNPEDLDDLLRLIKAQPSSEGIQSEQTQSRESGQREAYDNSDLREWENVTASTHDSLREIFREISWRNVLTECVKCPHPWQESVFGVNAVNRLVDNQTQPDYQSFISAVKQFRRFDGNIDTEEPLSWYEAVGIVESSRLYLPTPKKTSTVLEIGIGEGRIGGMLARSGLNVFGLEISPEQLKKLRQRITEEGAGLRGEADNLDLSYTTLKTLEAEGLLPGDIDLNDQEVDARITTIEGSMFSARDAINRYLQQQLLEDPWGTLETFGIPWTEHVEGGLVLAENLIKDTKFDMIIFPWHIWDEIPPEIQEDIARQVYDMLDGGGTFMIETPDRNMEPYVSAIQQHHAEHPTDPYGTIRDKKPDDFENLEGEEYYPSRYFPDRNELLLLLNSVGFKTSANDNRSYVVKAPGDSGINRMSLKEHVIIVRKPFR